MSETKLIAVARKISELRRANGVDIIYSPISLAAAAIQAGDDWERGCDTPENQST